MRRLLCLITFLILIAVPANAMEFKAPSAPEQALKYMPDETESFGEGLQFIVRSAIQVLQPGIVEAGRVCLSLIAVSLVVGLVADISENVRQTVEMVGVISVAIFLFQPVNSLIRLGTETVQGISRYGNLLLPVMAGALAAQGAVTKSGALYTATVFVDSILSNALSELVVPVVYILLCVATANHLFTQPILGEITKFLKWVITWGLKTVLYIFTGYISITGVVSGTTDAAMLKATKLTISGMVPAVGNILSDASEAVLVSAGMMKNAAGIYGLLTMIAIWIVPFLQIGVQYLMLKITSGICEMFGTPKMVGLMKNFSTAMGLTLAMTGTVCLILVISTICFMKGVS